MISKSLQVRDFAENSLTWFVVLFSGADTRNVEASTLFLGGLIRLLASAADPSTATIFHWGYQ
jgi:hypothetical protein